MAADLRFVHHASDLHDVRTLIVTGRKERLLGPSIRAALPPGAAAVWDRMLAELTPGDAGASASTWLGGDGPERVGVAVLPDLVSRHNCSARPDALSALLGGLLPKRGTVSVIAALDDTEQVVAAAAGVARALPLYSRKTGKDETIDVRVAFVAPDEVPPGLFARAVAVGNGVRLASRLVDAPTSEMDVEAFVAEAQTVAQHAGAAITVLRGEELAARGYGGLWSVGRAARVGPALVVLSRDPSGEDVGSAALVGKGIVYDTGGLSLKPKGSMAGMKGDMAGAAAVLAAFAAAAALESRWRLHALLCLAENAVGPDATRPDDIVTLYSGKTVEVNNPDAEGRLVVGDGVAHAAKHLTPDVIVDLATLTGAQMVATGKRHAAVIANDEVWEQRLVAAGRRTGDLVHPLPYAPELFRKEFKSSVADLKNSVKDRNNAQSSCAAQFIAEQLGGWKGAWAHVDMAGPADNNERATGYGVALLVDLFG